MPSDLTEYSIPFNRPTSLGIEQEAVSVALEPGRLAGRGAYAGMCEDWFLSRTGCPAAHFMSSCTQALEMAALLADIEPGDEVIMPSFTFVSTANAVVLRGATPVFVDARLDTCNLDEKLVAQAVTPRTRAIMPVHYAGIACDMEAIMETAGHFGLIVIEDAAHGVMATWRGRALGSIGHLGAYSFHATKNYTSGGEGGLLLVNDPAYVRQSEIVRDMGTNRADFFRGNCRNYEWLSVGSSYHASELQAAALSAQLEQADQVNDRRRALWYRYQHELASFCQTYGISLPGVPDGCEHNGHIFYVLMPSGGLRDRVISHMQAAGVQAQSHYQPLHGAPAAARYARTSGSCANSTRIAETIIRLPIYYALSDDEQQQVIDSFKVAVRACMATEGPKAAEG